jgi:very-short-patch-repair endonuclease
VFGRRWLGTGSDWKGLGAAAAWILENLDIHTLAARVGDRQLLLERCRDAASVRDRFADAVEALLRAIKATPASLIAPETVRSAKIDAIEKSLSTWRDESEQLSKWVAYRTRASKAVALGLSDLVQRLHDGRIAPDQAQTTFEMAYFEAVFADQVGREPELAQFDGDLHNRIVQSFSDLDRQRIRQSALEVVRAHHKRIPPQAGGKVGPLGTLRGEIAKKRGHMPIRKLMQQAGPAIQALKPVFMMSPLSVAQFLEPGSMNFDLLVMDEASQIQPVDALGAIARCRQVVVVGDPQQLPPTAFFSKMTGNGDEGDDDGATRVADIESILGLFTARGLPMRMLRWHYRSRHESLIAVSNRQFYENKLFIVPSPYTAQAGMGLRFHHITDGIFESGTTRTNPIEAKAVARAIIEHAISHPELSLGVAAFSAAQRRAILDQVELLRRALPPEHEAFFQAHPAEPFFVKNLENVQGDERDVIFISVGYGPTAPGLKPPMRFGPLGQDGGERRLNVLISRAKRRCEVFASMTDEDIDPDFASGRKGVLAFKMFMHFARTGRMTMAEASARDHDSIFEAQVAEALHARGYQAHRQVGIAGFFIDLAIADPERADRYLVGIECDGAAYHSARSARDRDRLRQAILEDHGWIIHRVWSTDWFRRPKAELDRVARAIEAAKAELAARGEREAKRRPVKLEIVSVDREDVTEMGLVAVEAPEPAPVAYVEANLIKPSHVSCDLHEAPTGILTQLAEQVVAIEAPVHIDEIICRIRDAWGLKRAGGRIQDAVERAVAVAVRQHRIMEDDYFYSVPHGEVVVRDRSGTRSATLRKPEMLPPAEIRVALLDIISRNFGATEDQVVLAASRAFGFKSTSGQLREIMLEEVQQMLSKEELARRDSLIELGPNAPVRAAKEPAPTPLEKLIGTGESEKLEFKQTLRWDVRQQTVNKKLEDVVIKTIAAFANGSGGTLLIGVRDDGVIAGIEQDVASTGGSLDKLELHATNLLNSHFPTAFWANRVKVAFPSVGASRICRIDVEASRNPLYVKVGDRNGVVAERLFVRSGNSSHEVSPSQIAAFVRERFGQGG